MSGAVKPREAHIETLRGLACVLLVAYHVVGNDPSHGLRVGEGDPWRFFIDLFDHVRMPLFTFISGLVFAADPSTAAAWTTAMGKKLRRLGLPLLSVSTLFWAVSSITAQDDVPPLWMIYVTEYQHFWFLQATLLIMGALLTLGLLAGGGRRVATLVYLPVVAVFLAAPEIRPSPFSVIEAVYLAPFFLAGYLIRGWRLEVRVLSDARWRPLVIAVAGTIALVLLAVQAATLAGWTALPIERRSVFGLALGLSTCVVLLAARPVVPAFAWIGTRSYAIYLFHVFFTAAVREGIWGIDPDAGRAIVFLTALVAGVFAPMVVERLLLRWRPAALLLLGIETARRPTPPPGAAVGVEPRPA